MIIEIGPSANITASLNEKLWPNAGYKWRILSLAGYINTSSTTGTRSVLLYGLRGYVGGFPNAPGSILLSETTTTVSSTFVFQLDFTSQGSVNSYYPPVITDADAIQFEINLQTDDVAAYTLVIEQVME